MHYHQRHQAHHDIHMVIRSPPRRPDIIPSHRLPFLVPETSTIVKRDSDPSQSCSAGDSSSKCEKPTSTTSTTTLPVVLGAVVPILCAVIVLIYLHRRNVRKLRNEDANDKHKSLDFGLDLEPTGGGRAMRQTEKTNGNHNHNKGISLDIGPSPYLLPPSLHGSRDSLHSLSRSIGGDDKYRHATSFLGGDNVSVRSHSRGVQDDASSFTGSTSKVALGDDMKQGLLRNAQRMSRSSPPLYTSPSENSAPRQIDHDTQPDHGFQFELPRSPSPVLIPGAPSIKEPIVSVNSVSNDTGKSPKDDHSLPEERLNPALPDAMVTPRISLPLSDAASNYDNRNSDTTIPAVNVQMESSPDQDNKDPGHPAISHTLRGTSQAQDLAVDPRRDTRRLTLGLRPLPPEDPSDNPEQRANRIRSFYKEYFDENKNGRETYYGPDLYQDGGYIYDPATGDYYDGIPAPFAEPVNRRAMTPPPRAPPRFQGAGGHLPSGSIGGFSDRFNSPGPRAFSSASGRLPGAPKSRKPAPPPAPLQILPTPHMLKDDSIMGAIDYAPGKSYKDQREGRPGTPLGGLQPFSPTMRAHTPLVSAFNELAAMPSPHALRKSGTYDNLDFAPPPRFKNLETASDSGSIRSNRTGISTTHLQNIRTGAYRVSRLPPETVGTKDDLISNLRPTWDMRK
ncbi:uncharacterized protein BDW43DRAFT_291218 [Aspergillus alliaceus]|uniref:uncharacterized protein n=1 Tax=Petromyces alliaceus TaxID=209559 RepID=UPI0012A5528F|nr:uncharacterized protein BDW43DRAFT_291218 [Aspergillus alliaceus]KAB8228509.1 hypothetical protein BDW43DRAFT_291218 [Aspergillus alliaceus]